MDCVDISHHALLGGHQAVPVALWRDAAEGLHFVGMGFSVEQTVQGQLRRAVGLGALLFLPRQVLLAHGVVPIDHGGEGRRGLLGGHDSAVDIGENGVKEKETVRQASTTTSTVSPGVSWAASS